ncbi:pilus assembly protein [Ruegeria sp. 2205SS24-7]|uniref:TadE/TadG family type IV pilus assembly protein n=1 Tax=Ruegeria discodermiae TaxID=3064389 RepID=UPI0027409306|nr:TadE family protein [Ruegeria sp. 2205SS24-7]MDP5216635.1 pilus assembly protein [Ruegeria sp. 2205SS24-7]
MRPGFLKRLRRVLRNESGTATIEFVMVFPVVMFLVASGAEMAMLNIHRGMLERAVDTTVRDIRLSTGTHYEHDDVKQTICERAEFIEDCNSNLRLELVPVDPRVAVTTQEGADCIDRVEVINPQYRFTNGQSNELMVMHACVLISPILPTSHLGAALADNEDGKYRLFATTAFVQEPQ